MPKTTPDCAKRAKMSTPSFPVGFEGNPALHPDLRAHSWNQRGDRSPIVGTSSAGDVIRPAHHLQYFGYMNEIDKAAFKLNRRFREHRPLWAGTSPPTLREERRPHGRRSLSPPPLRVVLRNHDKTKPAAPSFCPAHSHFSLTENFRLFIVFSIHKKN